MAAQPRVIGQCFTHAESEPQCQRSISVVHMRATCIESNNVNLWLTMRSSAVGAGESASAEAVGMQQPAEAPLNYSFPEVRLHIIGNYMLRARSMAKSQTCMHGFLLNQGLFYTCLQKPAVVTWDGVLSEDPYFAGHEQPANQGAKRDCKTRNGKLVCSKPPPPPPPSE